MQTAWKPLVGSVAAAVGVAAVLAPVGLLAGEKSSGWRHGAPFAYEEGLLDPIVGRERKKLVEKGVNLHFSALGFIQSIAEGGAQDETVGSGSYDFQAYFDGKKMGLWEGVYGLFRAEGKSGDAGINPYTGAVIPVNFDAIVPEPDGTVFEPTEYWLSQTFFDDRLEVLGGMYEIARFFDFSPFSGPYHYRFLNSHMFFNSVLPPFAPYNLLGGAAIVKPNDWLTVTTGVVDPNSSAIDTNWFNKGDYTILHEWRTFAPVFSDLPTMATIGVAYKNQPVTTIDQPDSDGGTKTKDDDWAIYFNFNQWLYQDPRDPHRAVGLFGRWGHSDGDVNFIENHFSLGLVADGVLFEGRPRDSFGVVGWYNEFSDDLSSDLDDSSSGFEVYYRFQATPWLQITPDVQYLFEPGPEKGSDDTIVVGARALIHF